MKKSNLDEMQEMTWLRINHIGMWVALGALLIVILVEFFLGADRKQMLGEVIVVVILCIYLFVNYLRHGIWGKYLKPTLKSNLLISIGTATFAFFMLLRSFGSKYQGPDQSTTVFIPALLISALTFGVLFTINLIVAHLYKKHVSKLEQDCET